MKVANAIIQNIVDVLGLEETHLSILAEVHQRSFAPETSIEDIIAVVTEGDDIDKVLKILRLSEDLITEDIQKIIC